jgi:hypothetical protein
MKPLQTAVVATALAAALVLLAACGGSNPPALSPVTARASAGERWLATPHRNYQFTLHTACFCLPEEDIVMKVRNGLWASATYTPSGQAVPAARLASLPTTVDALLALIDRAAALPAAVLTVTYNPNVGAPQSIYIDWVQNIADDEFTYTVSNFTLL